MFVHRFTLPASARLSRGAARHGRHVIWGTATAATSVRSEGTGIEMRGGDGGGDVCAAGF